MTREAILAEFRACRELLRTAPSAGRARREAFAAHGADSPLHAGLLDLLLAFEAFMGGRFLEAEATARTVLDRAVGTGELQVALDAANLLGIIDYERGEYSNAMEHYTLAARFIEACGATGELGRLYNNLGLVAWRLSDLPRARANFELALRHFGPDGPPSVLGNIHNNLGLVYEDGGDRVAAEAAYRQAITLLRGVAHDEFLANALANLGDLVYGRGEFAAARSLQAAALAARVRVGHQRGIVTSHVALARIALDLDELDVAEVHCRAGLDLARQIGLRKQEADALALAARLAERTGDFVGALRAERAAAALREQVFGEQMSERVAALQLRFDAWQARHEARRAEEEKARMAATMVALRAADEARTRFLAMMSHELRTPLTSAIGAAELLRRGDIGPRERRLADIIVSSSEALLAAIGDVLDLTRAEQTGLELTPEPVSPRHLAEQVLAIVSPAAEERGLALELSLAPSVPAHVSADPARLRQVMLNLVANAVKFTDRGRVDLRLDAPEACLRIQVEDTGIGIPASFADRIFEPFRQADTSRTRRHGGSGLGLTVVRRIVDAMGGTIAFRSAEGVGTVFTVELPLPASGPPAYEPLSAESRRYTVLLVEDDPSVREVVSDMLGCLGADVTAVEGGAAALAAFAARPRDLVVLDVHMPVLDGIAVARRLRADHGDGLRILGLSGATSDADRRAAEAAGMDGWLPKPVSLRRLSAEIARIGLATGVPAPRTG